MNQVSSGCNIKTEHTTSETVNQVNQEQAPDTPRKSPSVEKAPVLTTLAENMYKAGPDANQEPSMDAEVNAPRRLGRVMKPLERFKDYVCVIDALRITELGHHNFILFVLFSLVYTSY